ncbi:hypothetical protein TrCOL_g4755, partial [Triparma columacea]
MNTLPIYLLVLLVLISSPVYIHSQSLDDVKASLISQISSATSFSDLPTLVPPPKPVFSPIIVVGGGLSGLTASLYLLEAGHTVTLIDREGFLGGNSAKASSGINGAYTTFQEQENVEDSNERFLEDTVKSSGRGGEGITGELVRRMVEGSKEAVEWLLDRASIPPPILVGQMGGHTSSRTHRPLSGLAGAAFISGLEKAVMKYREDGQLKVMTGTRVVETEKVREGGEGDERSESRKGTNGAFTTGDGIKLARHAGAGTVDMEMVQVHPTGFSDVPTGFSDTPGRSLILCAEILRGAGSVLLDRGGSRFVDELETRKHVTDKMNNRGQVEYAIVVPPHAAEATVTHMNIYTGKGLLHEVEGMEGVRDYIKVRLNGGKEPVEIHDTFKMPINETSTIPRSAPTVL